MEYIESYADNRHKAWCIHCGTAKTGRFTRDHIPSKSLLDSPLPDNTPTFSICPDCNNDLSQDEEYLKIVLTCILEGTCEPQELKDKSVARALLRNAPLLEDIRRVRRQYDTLGGERRVIWQPSIERLLPPLIKNARGHFIYELGERAEGDPIKAGMAPLDSLDAEGRAAFETVSLGQVWPEVGSRMMTRMAAGTGLTNGWVVVQPSVYRYAIHELRSVRIVLREYLAFEAIWD